MKILVNEHFTCSDLVFGFIADVVWPLCRFCLFDFCCGCYPSLVLDGMFVALLVFFFFFGFRFYLDTCSTAWFVSALRH